MFQLEKAEGLEMKFKVAPNCDHCVPRQAHDGEWYDLSTIQEYTLKAGEFALLGLGFAIQLPQGYEAILAPRSSTFRNYGILQANGIGVIDNTYCGDNDWWRFPAYTTRDVTIPQGARIAQFRIQEIQPPAELIRVNEFGTTDRGGLGSTGV